jgi:F0F1-type ATP synthase assembly protein I
VMDSIKRILLVAGSTVSVTVVALVVYFLFASPSLISLFLLTMIAPVFLILGLGMFKAARDNFTKSSASASERN